MNFIESELHRQKPMFYSQSKDGEWLAFLEGLPGLGLRRIWFHTSNPKCLQAIFGIGLSHGTGGGTGRWNRWPKYRTVSSEIGHQWLENRSFPFFKMFPFYWQTVTVKTLKMYIGSTPHLPVAVNPQDDMTSLISRESRTKPSCATCILGGVGWFLTLRLPSQWHWRCLYGFHQIGGFLRKKRMAFKQSKSAEGYSSR